MTKFTILIFYLFFWWDWGLTSGLHTCKVGTLLLEPHLQSILLWLFWRWGLENLDSSSLSLLSEPLAPARIFFFYGTVV
jgi:hypothetical protein